MRISFSLRPTVWGCGSWWLCYEGSLRSGWALRVYCSRIHFERGEDWQEFVRGCICLSFQRTSNVQLLFCALKASHATSLLSMDIISTEGAASTVCCCDVAPSPMHNGPDVSSIASAAHWLLGSCPSGTMDLRAMPNDMHSNWSIACQ